ncbi:hypothetical protein PS3A_37730 [Pseudomonas sp. 3A(2025)]
MAWNAQEAALLAIEREALTGICETLQIYDCCAADRGQSPLLQVPCLLRDSAAPWRRAISHQT